jgi:site-specific recombinase XerD
MLHNDFYITTEKIDEYTLNLRNDERADNTVEKYVRDVRAFAGFLSGKPVTKDAAIEWKVTLKQTHAVSSVNSMIAAVNSFFAFFGLGVKIKPYRVQRHTFLPDRKDLSKAEYERLMKTAKSRSNERLFYVIQTICATGIRVGELPYITVEAVRAGQAQITGKGKTRVVFVSEGLKKALLKYAKKRSIVSGCIFITKSGKPLNRSNIWTEMKKLCAVAEVEACKVFPHNLRGLFSRTFYAAERDIAKLADVLGHSNIDTTRIYIMESSAKHRRIIENLGLARLRYT